MFKLRVCVGLWILQRKILSYFIIDNDDLEYIFKSLDDSDSKIRVEIYIEKVQIDLGQSLTEFVQYPKVGEDCENTLSTCSVQGVR